MKGLKGLLSTTAAALLLCAGTAAKAQYLGQYSVNPLAPQRNTHPFGMVPAPGLYDQSGGYHGRLSTNQLDPNSVSNPLGRYGSSLSPDSVNNPLGRYGSPLAPESPNNQLGRGLSIYGDH